MQHRLEVVLPWVLLLTRLHRLSSHRLLLAHLHEATGLLIRLPTLNLHEGAALSSLHLRDLTPLLSSGILVLVLVVHFLAHLLLLSLTHRALLLLLLLVV